MRRLLTMLVAICVACAGCDKSNIIYGGTTGVTPSEIIGGNQGNMATSLLRANPYSTLTIEIDYMPGLRPDIRSINLFHEILQQRLNKPGGISITEKEINPTLREVFSLDDVRGIESRNRTVFTGGSQITAYIVFVSGRYQTGNVVGLAYGSSSICYFSEGLNSFYYGETEEDRAKGIALLMLHEFGHLMGLVNIGSPMCIDHQDPGSHGHCINNNCIMHHSVELSSYPMNRSLIADPSYDQNCINDLRANGGR